MNMLLDNIIESWNLNDAKRTNESGCRIFSGYARDAQEVHEWLRTAYNSDKWTQELAWCDAYRSVWISVFHRATLTWVEGDLILSAAPDADSFYKELASSSDFYKDN